MARDTDGWEYVHGHPRWAPTVPVQMANILGGLYGDEYDQRRAELDGLARAAQRDDADRLHKAGYLAASELIFPTYPEENSSE